jgi:hypothetical protein
METSARLAALFTRADLWGAVAAVTPERAVVFYITLLKGQRKKFWEKIKKETGGDSNA